MRLQRLPNARVLELHGDHAVFTPLSRATFDRLLPDLALWLPLGELEIIARAYQGHAGYEQAWRDPALPESVRPEILAGLATAQRKAHDCLAERAFRALDHRHLAARDAPSAP